MSSPVLEAQNGSPAKRHGKARILVVDDYPDARTLLAIALNRRGGYEVATAGSAEEALRLIDTRFVRTTDEGSRVLDLELLILDIMMPDMTGLELLQKLRDGFASLPRVMVISAVDAHERLAEALRL